MQIWGVSAWENVFHWNVIQRMIDDEGVEYALCRGPHPQDAEGIRVFRVVTGKPAMGDLALFDTEEEARARLAEWFPKDRKRWFG